MIGRSMFSKIMIINIISMLISIIILGTTQMLLLTSYISKQSEDALSQNAETIISMVNGDIPMETLNNMLNGFSHVTGNYICIFDNKGKVITSTSNNRFVQSSPVFLESEYTKVVLSGQKYTMIGNMGNLFTETMFTLQIPIRTKGNTVIGAVSVSRPIPEHQKMKYDMFQILLISIFIMMITSSFLAYILAKKFSVPMKNIGATTKEFAGGNFAARVGPIGTQSDISEIAELAQAFNKMAAELEKSEEIKNSFISDVSHELRTPMTTIAGFVTGILDDTIPQDKQKDYLKIVHDEITRLSRLVNTFLDITRMQSDKLTLNKSVFDINELVRICIIGLESKIAAAGIDIELNFETESCYAYADRDSIMRVLTNLLDNAVKFTNKGGLIIVTVKTVQHDVIVSVRNTGCGIPKEQQAMIFTRFYKGDRSRSQNKDGTGIGLYLVKNILQAHGKDISINSVEGEYAEFIFNLEKGKHPKSTQ